MPSLDGGGLVWYSLGSLEVQLLRGGRVSVLNQLFRLNMLSFCTVRVRKRFPLAVRWLGHLCDEHMDRIADGRVLVLAPVFRSYGRRQQFHGPVSTVKVFEDNTLVRKALEEPGAGKVLVVDGGGSLRCALLGGMLGTLACQNLWAGIIVNGCCRDVDEINATDIGVRALASHPLKSNKRGQGERDVPVVVAGCRIQPGDWCYVDNDGIVISVGGEKLHNQRARV
ncbi:hypothetical protein R1sor_001321 [Riccia sorocarpa]|uniref:4-hydroxy-4-methyl-2-oxoglutarate aldolase n=1 Tax=Riccia sorocarpa TaxID=122646 RepID=A0ABD3H1L7_9MARC